MSLLDFFPKTLVVDLVDSAFSWRPSRSGVFKFLLYLAYGLVVFFVVWSVKYYVRQADALARKAVAGLDGISVEFSHIEPQLFPPQVVVDYLSIANSKTNKTILKMTDADIRLSLFPLLVGKVSFSIKARIYGGLAEADVTSGALFDFDWISCDLTAEMLELEAIPQVNEYDRTLKGFGSIKTEFKGAWNVPTLISADLYLDLARLDMENRFPIVKGERLKGYRIDLDCSLEQGFVTVRGFDIQSDDGISLQAEGSVTLDGENFGKSKLDLTGKFIGPLNRLATSVIDKKAVAQLEKTQAVKVSVTGTLASVVTTVK